MDVYQIHCDLKPGVKDMEFVQAVRAYLDHLVAHYKVASYRITRCKLGLRPAHFGDFQIFLEFENGADFDFAFGEVASRTEPVESLHRAVNSKGQNLSFALYRDFPDKSRKFGEEKF